MAKQFTPAGSAAAGSAADEAAAAGSAADEAPADEAPPSAFVRVPNQPDSFVFRASDKSIPPPGKRVFTLDLPWLEGMATGGRVRFDVVPGLVDGCEWTLTEDPARLTCAVDAQAVQTPSFTVSHLLAAPPEEASEAPPSQPVPSHIRPPKPIADVEQRLAAQGWRLGSAQGRGDCAPLSICASHEITAQEAAVPSAATTKAILRVREQAVNLIAGSADIGGVPAAVVREREDLPKPTGQAMRFMKSWKKSYHWRGKGHASSAFLLGCALHTGRQVAVLALSDAGSFEDPARIYGQRSGSELRLTRATSGLPQTVPVYFLVPIDTLLEQLRANPGSFSLVRYNGTNHFDPYLFDATTAAAGETATEVVAGDVGAIDDVEEEAPPAARPPLPPGWVEPSAVNATARERDEDALQDSVRYSHVETGMSGIVQAPAIQEGTLSAHVARELAESRAPLPGNGETPHEDWPPPAAAAGAAALGSGDEEDDGSDVGEGAAVRGSASWAAQVLQHDHGGSLASAIALGDGGLDDETLPPEDEHGHDEESPILDVGLPHNEEADADEEAAPDASIEVGAGAVEVGAGAVEAVQSTNPTASGRQPSGRQAARATVKAKRATKPSAAKRASDPAAKRAAKRPRSATAPSNRAPPAPPPPPPPLRSGRVSKRPITLEDAGAFDGPDGMFTTAPAAAGKKPRLSTIHPLPAYAVQGARVVAMGSLGGAQVPFNCEIIKVLPGQRVHVRFLSDTAGNTARICLPMIPTAYVGADALLGVTPQAVPAPPAAHP